MMFLPVLSAILGILAFLPVNFTWVFGFVFLAPIFIFFLKEEKLWRLIFGAFVFRLVLGLGTAYYTLEPIAWLWSILIFLGLPISIFAVKKFSFIFLNYLPLFALPFLWTFFDHLEARYSFLPTYIFAAGNAFGSSPFLGLAAAGGLLFLTFFAAVINVLTANLILKIKTLNLKKTAFILAPVFILIFGAWIISNYQLKKNSVYYGTLKNSLKIAVISVNEKFRFNQAEQIKKELAGKKFDLIVFPEDMFNEISGKKSFDFFQNLSKESNVNLLAAFNTEQNGKRYNSAVLFNAGGEVAGVYNKNRLIFMSEYWPFGNWRPSFYDGIADYESENYAIFKPENSFARGGKKILSLNINNKTINIASPICLEIHYSADLKEYKKMGAKFFFNLSSNRWVDAGIGHFLYLADNVKKIEAAQLKTPIVSSGVKDYAGIITPDGKTSFVNYESENKNYGILFGEIKY